MIGVVEVVVSFYLSCQFLANSISYVDIHLLVAHRDSSEGWHHCEYIVLAIPTYVLMLRPEESVISYSIHAPRLDITSVICQHDTMICTPLIVDVNVLISIGLSDCMQISNLLFTVHQLHKVIRSEVVRICLYTHRRPHYMHHLFAQLPSRQNRPVEVFPDLWVTSL